MHCPNGDAELIAQTRVHNGLTITSGQCPRCRGYWLDAFNANYIKTGDITRSQRVSEAKVPIHPVCPTCQELLTVYHGQNVPATVAVWKCPNNHGYFFPEAQLFAFKKAQEAKLAYFTLWNIPLSSVASILLASFVGIMTLGVVTTYVQQRQTTVLQAQQIVESQAAYVAGKSVNIAITTSVKAAATVHIGDFEQKMQTTDGLLHTLFLTNLVPGTYEYYAILLVDGKTVRSYPFTFIIPQ